MKDSGFLKIAIIILLLINISTLVFFTTRSHGPMPPPGPGRGPFEFLVRELKMTPEQQEKYAGMRNDHRDAVEKLRDESQDLRNSFYDLLHQEPLDTTRVNTLSDSISNCQKQIELITFRHFSEVRSICTPEQEKQFDQIIDEALRMMHPPRRP